MLIKLDEFKNLGIIKKIKSYAGINFDTSRKRNPNITKREAIVIGDYIKELENYCENLSECLLYEFKANVKQFGLETAKKLNSCYILEKYYNSSIEEILK